MANTVTNISLANTFGEWVVATDALIRENNILATGDYTKDSGTLYLAESVKNSLQANGDVILQKQLRVVGTGSSAFIQNNLNVGTQLYLTNGTLSLVASGQANVSGAILALGPNIGLNVSNNAYIGGSTTIAVNTITNSLQSNNRVNTSNLSVVSTTYTNQLQANTNIVTDIVSANTRVISQDIVANNSISADSFIHGNRIVANTSVTTGTLNALTLVTAANVVSNGSISAADSVFGNSIQSNTHILTNTLSANASISATDITSSNNITANTMNTVFIHANTGISTNTLTVVYGVVDEELYANSFQANLSILTTTLKSNNTISTNNFTSNTVTTGSLSVIGPILSTNTVSAEKISSTGTSTFNNLLVNNAVSIDGSLQVGGDFTILGSSLIDSDELILKSENKLLPTSGYGSLMINRIKSRVTLYGNTIYLPSHGFANGQNVIFSSLDPQTQRIANNTTYRVIFTSTVGSGNVNFFQVANVGTPTIAVNFISTSGSVASITDQDNTNAELRWDQSNKIWQIKDVDNPVGFQQWSRILTANLISSAVNSTSTSTIASSNAVKLIKDDTDAAGLYANGAFLRANAAYNSQNTTGSYANSAYATANSAALYANGAFVRANTATTNAATADSKAVTSGSYANSAFGTANSAALYANGAFVQANAAFNRANTSSNIFVGTTGQVAPNGGVISYTSNNGVAVVATSANNFAISTPQDLRTTANPTFNSLSLTSPLAISQGGTGQTSASGALNALLPSGALAGYVLTTGGPGNYYWAAGGGGGGGGVAIPGTSILTTRLSYAANGVNNKFITPTFNNDTEVRAYINGVRQYESEYILFKSNTGIQFTTTPDNGDDILIEVDGYYVNPYYANNIAYTINSNISPTANTIQLAIDGLTSKLVTYYANTAAAAGTQAFGNIVTGLTLGTGVSNTAFATTAFVQNLVNGSGTLTTNITGNSGTVTNGVYTNGSYANPAWITSLASNKITGLATSATTDTTNATNITSGTLSAVRLPTSGVSASGYGTASSIPSFVVDATGRVTSASNVAISINSAAVSGLAASATTDTTSATNITSGTLAAARLPASGVTATGYGTSSSIPSFVVDATGRITSAANVAISINSADVSGLATSATTDTTIANNITSGTLSLNRLPSSGVAASGYGTPSSIPSFVVDAYGRIINAANVAISINSGAVSGLATSATTDTTNANNITSGTLPAGRLPSSGVSPTTYGSASSVPSFVVDGYGRITNASNVSISISSAAVSGLADSATTDTTNANNITSGTLSAARLPFTVTQNLAATSNVQFLSIGVGTAPSGNTGDIRATGDITSGFSDDNLKTKLGNIENALDKLMQLSGFYYEPNELAQSLGYEVKREVGVSAQDFKRILPEVVVPSPVSNDYLTVRYERIVPLLIEAIKELKVEVEALKGNNK